MTNRSTERKYSAKRPARYVKVPIRPCGEVFCVEAPSTSPGVLTPTFDLDQASPWSSRFAALKRKVSMLEKAGPETPDSIGAYLASFASTSAELSTSAGV